MLQDIDLSYDRTGAIATTKTFKAPTVIAGGTLLGPPFAPQPSDHGLIAWSSDPNYASATSAAVNGSLYLAAVYLRSAATISKVWWIHTTAGASATAGQSFAGLYNSTGDRLSSVGIDSQVVANGPQSPSLSTPQTVPAGRYWVALLLNAGTPPVLARTSGASATANNLNLSAASLRYAVNGTGLTAMPSSINPASNTTTGAIAIPVAVS